MSVLDASAVIALISADDAHHQAAVHIVEREFDQGFSISALTLAESLVAIVRSGRVADAMSILQPLELDVVALREQDAVRIAQTRVTSGLKMPDAVVLSVAVAREEMVITFDNALAAACARTGVTSITD